MAKKRFKISKMKIQRLYGAVLITLGVLVMVFAWNAKTDIERDITPVLFLFPLGIYALTTKEYILIDRDEYLKGEKYYGEKTYGKPSGAKELGGCGRSVKRNSGA